MSLNGKFLDKNGLTYLWSKLKTKFAAKQDAISDLASIRSGAAAGATAVQQTAFETDQQQQENEIGAVANAGAKNLLNVTAQSKGIVTVNADGTLTVNGSSTSNTSVTLSNLWLKKGTYWLSSGVQLPTGVYLSIRIASGGQILQVRDDVTELEFDVPSDTTIDRIWLFVNANTPVDNLTIYPMIRRAEITDDTFVPYAKTNRELTVAEDEDRAALIGQVDGGAKNFLDTYVSTLKKYNTASSAVWNGSSYTQNGITYSVNSDGTISVSGTATSTSLLVLANRTYLNTKITRGRYSISGCPTGGGSSGATYRIFCLNPNANISNGYTDTGNGYIGEFYYDDSKDCNIAIGVGKGCVITDPVVFKPMLCTAADYAISPAFVPYAKTNRELTVAEDEDRAALIGQVDGGAKNVLVNTAPYGELVRTNITFTHNSNDTYSVNAKNSNKSNTDLYVASNISLEPGDYILTGCPAGGDNNSTYKLQLTGIGYDLGNGLRFTISQTTTVSVYIRIWAGYTPSGLVFKPMICRVADYAISPAFVPYVPTNRELYETGQLCYDFIFGVGTALQNNDNLNDYKAPGKVFAANGAIAATIANTPWTESGFTAITIPNLTSNSCIQFVLPNTMGGKWYRRRFMQNTWSSWFEYDGTQVATT